MESKWNTPATKFTFGAKRYEWRYGKKAEKLQVQRERGEDCHCLLLLERIDGEGKKAKRTLLARFVRGEETRTPGTKKSHAGNGGRLEMALERDKTDAFAGLITVDDGPVDESGLEESIVVATLMVMLKKEIDRLRGGQIAFIGTILTPPSPLLTQHLLCMCQPPWEIYTYYLNSKYEGHSIAILRDSTYEAEAFRYRTA